MGKQKQTNPYLLWLLIAYIASRLMFNGYLSVQMEPDPSFSLPCPLASGPQESLGDGPGNAQPALRIFG